MVANTPVDSPADRQAFPCNQSAITGFAGAFLIGGGTVLLCLWRVLTHPTVPNRIEYVGVLLFVTVVMVLLEILCFKTHRRQFDFSRPCRLSRTALSDVGCQCGALFVTLVLAWGAYGVLGEYALRFTLFQIRYERSWYAPFFEFFRVATLAFPVAAIPYFIVCAMFRRWSRDDDEILRLWTGYARLARFKWPDKAFWGIMRSLLVKFFFIPVMMVFFLNNAGVFEDKFIRFLATPWNWDPLAMGRLFGVLYEGLFLVDVNIALLGYVCCFRLLDTHIRSAEPTFLGWAVALACYPPFNQRLTGVYIPHDPSAQTWSAVLQGMPWLYFIVGMAILALLWIYLHATLVFGLRFSNLTHRGIIDSGPYRWVRHPAYAAKNLSWWLISLPFLRSPGDCIRLLLLNGIYVMRALTEERHLSRDPAYRQYSERVKWRFIPGFM